MAGHNFERGAQRWHSRDRHSLLSLTAAGASCFRLTTPFSLPAARSLLPLPARSVPSVPEKCHFGPAAVWQLPPSPWGDGQEGAGEPAGEDSVPARPSRPRAGKGRARFPGTSSAHTAAAGPFSLRAEGAGTARHVLGSRCQLRRQGHGGGAGGEEAAEALLRLPRDQEGAGRLVGTRPRAARAFPPPPPPLCAPAPPGFSSLPGGCAPASVRRGFWELSPSLTEGDGASGGGGRAWRRSGSCL